MFTLTLSAGLVLVSLLLFAVSLIARQRVSSPAVGLFALTAAVAGAGTVAIAVGFLVRRPLFVLGSAVVVALVLPIPWTRFTLQYGGMDYLVSERAIAVATAPLGVGLVATALLYGLPLISDLSVRPADSGGPAVLAGVTALNMTQWFALLYAGGLMLLSSGVLVWLFHRYDHLDSTTGTTLGVFGTIPWLSVLFGLQINSISSFALGLSVAGGFLIGGVTATPLVSFPRLFERVPAAGSIGPATVIDELTDVVVVTDTDGRIVEANDRADGWLAPPTEDLLGAPVESVLDADLSELRATETLELAATEKRGLVEPTVSTVTDQHGVQFGYAIVLREVTDRVLRKQRLAVLNRVLRHNLRNDMTVIGGRAETIQERTDDDAIADEAAVIHRTARTLSDLAADAREADMVLNTKAASTETARLASVVDAVLAAQATGGQALTCTTAVPSDVDVAIGEKPLRIALDHLVDNAIKHNDSSTPELHVAASTPDSSASTVALTVSDNGPGIPDHEIPQRGADTKSPLEHGTGIGLLLVQWIVMNNGGTIEFASLEPRGTAVTIELPIASQ